MKLKQIEILLMKYEQGETSLQEEQVLKSYFSQPNVAPHLMYAKVLFQFYSGAAAEHTTKIFDVPKHISSEKKTVSLFQKYKIYITGIAASILIAVTIYTYNNGQLKEKEPAPQNPELAYFEARKALLLISEKLNKATENVDKLSKFNEVQHLLTSNK